MTIKSTMLHVLLGSALFQIFQRFCVPWLQSWFYRHYHQKSFSCRALDGSVQPVRWRHRGWAFFFTICLILFSFQTPWQTLSFGSALPIFFSLISIAWFDASTGWIPDPLNASLLLLGMIHSFLTLGAPSMKGCFYWPLFFFASAMISSHALARLPYLWIGGGDLKLFAALSWLGMEAWCQVVWLALIASWARLKFFKPKRTWVKFGPYLSASAAWYLSTHFLRAALGFRD